MTPQEYCQDKVAHSGSSFYYSFLSLPDEKHDAIIALYAFCREIDDIADMPSETHIKAIKLNWWRDEINQLFSRTPQHPISKALLPVIERYDLPMEYFMELIDGMEMDLDNVRFSTFNDLRLYCYRVASVVGLMSAQIFGYQDRNTLKYAHDLGIALQLTNIIRDVYEDIRRDRIYLPQDEMQRFGVSAQDLRLQHQTEGFRHLMEYQAQRAGEYYQRAFEQLPDTDRYQQRAGIIMAAIYQALLTEIMRDNYQVLKHKIVLTPMRKLWIAWKTKRAERKLNRRLLKQKQHA